MKTIATGLLLTLASAAWADEVHLRNGQKILACIAVEKGGKVEIEIGIGRSAYDKKDVEAIKITPCPLKEYPAKLEAARAAGKAAALYDLATWCKKEAITKHVRTLLEELIKLDPDHAAARRELGYQKMGGHWLTGDALKKALGYVKVDGTWMTLIEAELHKGKQLTAKERQLSEAEERAKERREAEEAREDAMKEWSDRLAEERRRAEQNRERRYGSWGWGSSCRPYHPWYGYSILGSLGYGYYGGGFPTMTWGPGLTFPPKPTPSPLPPPKYDGQ